MDKEKEGEPKTELTILPPAVSLALGTWITTNILSQDRINALQQQIKSVGDPLFKGVLEEAMSQLQENLTGLARDLREGRVALAQNPQSPHFDQSPHFIFQNVEPPAQMPELPEGELFLGNPQATMFILTFAERFDNWITPFGLDRRIYANLLPVKKEVDGLKNVPNGLMINIDKYRKTASLNPAPAQNLPETSDL